MGNVWVTKNVSVMSDSSVYGYLTCIDLINNSRYILQTGPCSLHKENNKKWLLILTGINVQLNNFTSCIFNASLNFLFFLILILWILLDQCPPEPALLILRPVTASINTSLQPLVVVLNFVVVVLIMKYCLRKMDLSKICFLMREQATV